MAGLASLSIDEQARPYLIAISPNQDGKRPGTTGIILHSTRSGKPGADDYYLTVNYFEQRGTASAHRVIGRKQGQHAQMVADEKIAWHAKEDNRYWLGIEFAQAVPTDDTPNGSSILALRCASSGARSLASSLHSTPLCATRTQLRVSGTARATLATTSPMRTLWTRLYSCVNVDCGVAYVVVLWKPRRRYA